MNRHAPIALLFCLLGLNSLAAVPRKETVVYQGVQRVCHVYSPDDGTMVTNRPLLLVLHGSGQGGRALAGLWETLALREGFVVSGPDTRDVQAWNPRYDGPGFLHAVVEAIAARHAVDRRRVYLFGYSGGAHFGLQMALAESEYFAAAAIYAGELREAERPVARLARRRLPLALFAGSEDRVVPAAKTRGTFEFLKAQGFPCRYVAMPGWGHDYTHGRYDTLHRQVWEFLRSQQLTVDPVYREYPAADR